MDTVTIDGYGTGYDNCSKAVNRLLGIEGGYSNHISDTGGKTRFGITEAKAREFGYEGDMRELPLGFAKRIYLEDFWVDNELQYVARKSLDLAYEIFEFAVNAGDKPAGRAFQRSLNAFNKGQEYYEDITVDGLIGPQTLKAWRAFYERRGIGGDVVMIKAVNGLQADFYIGLAEANDRYEDFVYGWISRRIDFNVYTW